RLATVDQRYRTPSSAIVLAGLITAGASLLGRAVLIPISEVGSLACALGWLATCLALCAGAGGQITRSTRMLGAGAALVGVAFAAIAISSFGPYHVLTLVGWAALGLILWDRKRSLPK